MLGRAAPMLVRPPPAVLPPMVDLAPLAAELVEMLNRELGCLEDAREERPEDAVPMEPRELSDALDTAASVVRLRVAMVVCCWCTCCCCCVFFVPDSEKLETLPPFVQNPRPENQALREKYASNQEPYVRLLQPSRHRSVCTKLSVVSVVSLSLRHVSPLSCVLTYVLSGLGGGRWTFMT